ncbi:MAG: cation:proton antiporter [Beijerinckiaceae bacterium]|nr:cation:proton antiporter [Beijerinckiaceae bacterium]
MEHQLQLTDYKEAILFLITAGIVVPVFHRLRISPVLGFIAAGVLLGPFGLGRLAETRPIFDWVSISNIEQLSKVAELGVAFLLFMIGLELSFERLTRMRKLVFGLGAAQVAVTTLVIGEIAYLSGLSVKASVAVGAALALSSTAIVMPVLAERKRLNSSAGRTAFAILLFQDLMVAPFLFMISVLGDAEAGGGVLALFVSTLAPALVALAALVGFGRLLIRPLFHHVAAARSTELFVAACLLVIMAAAVGAASAGMSMALGAFIAGLLLAETEYRREVEVTIEPFKGLLLGLFFLTVGAGLDFARIIAEPLKTIGITIALIAGKFLITYALARSMGVRAPAAREAALVNAPGGEFAFVMLGAAIATSLIDRALGSQLAVAVTLSMITIPFLAALGARLSRSTPRPVDASTMVENAPESDTHGHVIIVGHGRVGALVGEMLARHKITFMAVDGDPRLVSAARDLGVNIYWGDASRPDFLHKCGIMGAKALVVTMDAPAAVEKVVQAARAQRSDLTIVARARDAAHAAHLYEIGATDAVPETIEASLQLAEALLVDIGVPAGFVIASVHEKRDEFRAYLQKDGVERERRGIRLSRRVKEMSRPRKAEPSA